MEKVFYLNNLFDLYGCLLTEKQCLYFKEYYFNNLSKSKVILPKKNVYKTIELPVNFFDFQVGTEIRME